MKLTKTEKLMFALAAAFLLALFVFGIMSSRPGRVVTEFSADPSRVLTAADDGEEDMELLPGETVDINSADAAGLQKIPGIGQVLAGRIIEKREELHGFSDINELAMVKGIGEKTLDEIKDYVTIGAKSENISS